MVAIFVSTGTLSGLPRFVNLTLHFQ